MFRKGGFFSAIVLVLLFAALGVSLYYLYQFWPREPVDFEEFNSNDDAPLIENSVPSKQFYPRMRYQDRIITYSIASSCSADRVASMHKAFDLLDEATVLSFTFTASNAMIKILCSDIAPEAGQEDYFVAGEGGPARVLNSTLYSIILEGKIALYRDDQCNGAKVATHELLHALGFDHNNNPGSILYPTLKCDQEIDPGIIDSINRLYKSDSLSDLVFSEANATKGGRYLNFHIELLNQGLQPSEAVKIGVYSDGEIIDTFDVGAIDMGAKKILDVENLKVPSGTESIVFVADDAQTILELDEQNNRATLRLVQQ